MALLIDEVLSETFVWNGSFSPIGRAKRMGHFFFFFFVFSCFLTPKLVFSCTAGSTHYCMCEQLPEISYMQEL